MKLFGHQLSLRAVFLVTWDVTAIFGAVYAGSWLPALGLPGLWTDMDPILRDGHGFPLWS